MEHGISINKISGKIRLRLYYIILLIIYIYSILLSGFNGIHTIILLISFSIIILIIYKFIEDIILFIVFSLLLFSIIYASSISYNPYSVQTFLLFSIPVFLSIVFIEIEISPFKNYLSNMIKNVSMNAIISIFLSYIFIGFFGLFVFLQRDIVVFSILLSVIIITLIYLFKEMNRGE